MRKWRKSAGGGKRHIEFSHLLRPGPDPEEPPSVCLLINEKCYQASIILFVIVVVGLMRPSPLPRHIHSHSTGRIRKMHRQDEPLFLTEQLNFLIYIIVSLRDLERGFSLPSIMSTRARAAAAGVEEKSRKRSPPFPPSGLRMRRI